MNREGIELNPYLWIKFLAFAEDNGISTDHELDWGPWWDCWIDGYNTSQSE